MKIPMTPAEFDAEWRAFAKEWNLHQSSGRRTLEEQIEQGIDSPNSKHLLDMARDGKFPPIKIGEWKDACLTDAQNRFCSAKLYPWGIHVQGLPFGPVEEWWMEKYG